MISIRRKPYLRMDGLRVYRWRCTGFHLFSIKYPGMRIFYAFSIPAPVALRVEELYASLFLRYLLIHRLQHVLENKYVPHFSE